MLMPNMNSLKSSRTVLSHCLIDYFICKPISTLNRSEFYFSLTSSSSSTLSILLVLLPIFIVHSLLLLIFLFLSPAEGIGTRYLRRASQLNQNVFEIRENLILYKIHTMAGFVR